MSEELQDLIARYLAGTADDEAVRRLDELLRSDPAARRELFLAADQDAAVRDIFAVEAHREEADAHEAETVSERSEMDRVGPARSSRGIGRRVERRRRRGAGTVWSAFWIAAAAVVAAVLSVTFLLMDGRGAQHGQELTQQQPSAVHPGDGPPRTRARPAAPPRPTVMHRPRRQPRPGPAPEARNDRPPLEYSPPRPRRPRAPQEAPEAETRPQTTVAVREPKPVPQSAPLVAHGPKQTEGEAPAPERQPAAHPKPVAPEYIAHLNKTAGPVTVTAPGGVMAAARAMQRLVSGHLIEIGKEGGSARITYPDGTRFDLEQGCLATITQPARGKHLVLERGRLLADVARQPLYKPMIIRTAHAEVTVLGTRFRLTVEARFTHIEMLEGEVRFTRLKPRATIRRLRAGQQAYAGARMRLAAQHMLPRGLVALYLFDEAGGRTVRDRSGLSPALDLHIRDASAVRWERRGLAVRSPTVIVTGGPATRVIRACKRTNEITVEAWVQPAGIAQARPGPGRILTISRDTTQRNIALRQGKASGDTDFYEVRVRTTRTDLRGRPSMATPRGSLTARLTHVVFTRARDGRAVIYVNGTARAQAVRSGDLSNWSERFRLGLANELAEDRPWLGLYRRVAVYSRALTAREVQANYRAGADSGRKRPAGTRGIRRDGGKP